MTALESRDILENLKISENLEILENLVKPDGYLQNRRNRKDNTTTTKAILRRLRFTKAAQP